MASIESSEATVHARRGTMIDHGAAMISKSRLQARLAIAVAAFGSLALAGFLFESRNASRLSMPVGPPNTITRGEEDVARAKAILREIEGARRDERLQLWQEIDGLHARTDEVRSFLLHFAREEASWSAPYSRFVASATVAGFGRPSRIGPNSLVRGASLAWYIRFQRSLRVSGPRHLELDPALNGVKVEVEPNEKDDLTFTEILWTILVRYKLAFRLEPDGTFVIFPPPPLV